MKETVVPNRNMVMLSLAVSYAIGIGARKVYYGAHHAGYAIYPDCREEFVVAMKSAIALCDWSNVVLEAPYIEMDKGDILEKGIGLDVDYSLTWTCYEGRDKPCGGCGACVKRAEAFSANNESDPLYGKN
jgi:7-cyano-7-deazaguanine synthase